jgi:FlaA1/EpsC-like NDP-sugar epimerase
MRRDINTQRTFIYGVKSVGVGLAKNIKNQYPQRYSLAGFISPNGELVGQYLVGAKVYNDDEKLIQHLIHKRARVVMVSSLQTEHFRTRQDLINSLIDHNIKIMMIPEEIAWDGKTDFHTEQLREVDIEDLLPRDKIEVDMEAIGNQLRDKVILITGAAGSIGSEIVRQVAKFNPQKMILIDHAETPMHDIRLMMTSQFAYISSESIVASITNQELMEEIFKAGRPDYVFHAAAYKHVPMMEDNPSIAVQNNVYGTRVIADLAVKYRTKKFVMISTDKAVNPTNVMGCSKRICEIYCQSLNKAIVEGQVEGITQFVTTRFGNVLGSNGSVIPIFKEQIKKGGPITVTHPEIIRFFMLIPEACRLVLEAGTMGQGGEIYVFDMGKPVKIVDLAQRMIKLSGAQNIEIKFSGLREGEKLYEEVLSDKEQTKPTRNPKIMIAKVREYDYELAVKNEDRLREASYTFDDMAIVRIMKEIVPEYKSQHSKYEVLDVER